jgi:hypothetical protein
MLFADRIGPRLAIGWTMGQNDLAEHTPCSDGYMYLVSPMDEIKGLAVDRADFMDTADVVSVDGAKAIIGPIIYQPVIAGPDGKGVAGFARMWYAGAAATVHYKDGGVAKELCPVVGSFIIYSSGPLDERLIIQMVADQRANLGMSAHSEEYAAYQQAEAARQQALCDIAAQQQAEADAWLANRTNVSAAP